MLVMSAVVKISLFLSVNQGSNLGWYHFNFFNVKMKTIDAMFFS